MADPSDQVEIGDNPQDRDDGPIFSPCQDTHDQEHDVEGQVREFLPAPVTRKIMVGRHAPHKAVVGSKEPGNDVFAIDVGNAKARFFAVTVRFVVWANG